MPELKPLGKFREIYDKEVGSDNSCYTPLEIVILDSSTVRMFVYEICKEVLKEAWNTRKEGE